MKTKSYAVAGVVFAAALATSMYFSAHFAAYQMKSAVKAKDVASFSEYVDYPALRESLKGEYLRKIEAGSEDMGTFAGFGQMLAANLIEQVVGAMVSPSSVMAMMASSKPAPLPFDPSIVAGPTSKSERDSVDALELSYLDWSRVQLQNSYRGPENGAFILRREGVWGWKLVAVILPEKP